MFENGKETNRNNNRRIRRADIYLVAFFLFLAMGSLAWISMGKREGKRVLISCDGQTIADVPLSREGPFGTAGNGGETIRYCLILYPQEGVSCECYESKPDLALAVSEGSSYNLLAVSEFGVSVEAADCRDQICVHHRPVKDSTESIVCLPHRLVVEIAGETDKKTPDAVAGTRGYVERRGDWL